MPTFPQAVIPPFAAGYGPFPSTMAGWAQNPLGFCHMMPVFRGIQSGTAQSLSPGFNPLHIPAGAVAEDPYAGWSAVVTSKQAAWSYLVPFTGWYHVTVTVLTAAQAMWLAAGVQVSGGTIENVSNVNTPAGLPGGCSGSLIIPATGGIDYIQAGPAPSAAANTTTASAGLFSGIEIEYVSSG